MKKIRKITALLLAAVLIVAMAVPALAANHNISTDSTTHTYEIYQIFTGTYDSASGQLQNLKYGTNAKTGTAGESVSATDMAKLATIEGKTYTNDQEKIADLTQFVTLSNPVKTIGKNGTDTSPVSLAEGYYIIKDVDGSQDDANDSYTLYLFKVLNDDLRIDPKADTTTVDKTVTETNDTTATTTAGKKGADYDEGDSIPYSIDITLPDNIEAYKTYTVTLTDTLSEGLTPPATGDVTVTFTDAEGNDLTETFGTPTATVSGQVITVTYTIKGSNTDANVAIEKLANSDKLVNAKINVSYNAVLNNKAVVGEEGNPNTYSITYSNNPNGTGNGKTPDQEVKVFTYELNIIKTDGNGDPLEGADFTLYKEVAAGTTGAQTGAAIKATFEGTSVNASKLVDDKYYVAVGMTESTTEATEAVTEAWIYNETEYATEAEAQAAADADGAGDYSGITHREAADATDAAVTHKTDKNIDAGNYVLVETTVPAGYNAYAGMDVVFTSTIDADGNLTGLTATPNTLTVASDLSGANGTVENQSGSVLPSTGGMGTTVLYVVGAIIIVAAGVLLITRRRANAAK